MDKCNHTEAGAIPAQGRPALWCDTPHRPTRDADLLGFGPDDEANLIATFRSHRRHLRPAADRPSP